MGLIGSSLSLILTLVAVLMPTFIPTVPSFMSGAL